MLGNLNALPKSIAVHELCFLFAVVATHLDKNILGRMTFNIGAGRSALNTALIWDSEPHRVQLTLQVSLVTMDVMHPLSTYTCDIVLSCFNGMIHFLIP